MFLMLIYWFAIAVDGGWAYWFAVVVDGRMGLTIDGGELKTELRMLGWIYLRGWWGWRGEELYWFGSRKREAREREKTERRGSMQLKFFKFSFIIIIQRREREETGEGDRRNFIPIFIHSFHSSVVSQRSREGGLEWKRERESSRQEVLRFSFSFITFCQ